MFEDFIYLHLVYGNIGTVFGVKDDLFIKKAKGRTDCAMYFVGMGPIRLWNSSGITA